MHLRRNFGLTFQPVWREPVFVSLGPHLHGAMFPVPDVRDQYMLLIAELTRVASFTPTPDLNTLLDLEQFSDRLCAGEWPSITPGGALPKGDHICSISPEIWIAGASQWTAKQKKHILDILIASCPFLWAGEDPTPDQIREKDFWCKVLAFIKEEGYPTYKSARGINGRDTLARILFGPLVSYCEKHLYACWGNHVKGMTFEERTVEVNLRHGGYNYHISIDMSAFEASSLRALLAATTFRIYEWLLGDRVTSMIAAIMFGNNKIKAKAFVLKLMAKTMSGEMDTAYNNFVRNMIIQVHVLLCIGHGDLTFVNTDEGDDTLSSLNAPHFPTVEQFARYGLIAKIVHHHNLSHHSFCGVVVSESRTAITDPFKFLAKFGWVGSKYIGASDATKSRLLVSKALSFGYQYPNSPVIRAVVQSVFRNNKGVDADFSLIYRPSDPRLRYLPTDASVYKFLSTHPYAIDNAARQLMQDMFGMAIEHQLVTEWYFDNKDDNLPFQLDFLNFEPEWVDFFRDYVRDSRREFTVLEGPYPEPLLVEQFVNWAGNKENFGTIVVTNWLTLEYEQIERDNGVEYVILDADPPNSKIYTYGGVRFVNVKRDPEVRLLYTQED